MKVGDPQSCWRRAERRAHARARSTHAFRPASAAASRCGPVRRRPRARRGQRRRRALRARRPPLLAPAAARRLAERRRAPCGARRPGGPASAFAAAPCAGRPPCRGSTKPLPPAPRARRRASRPSGGAPWRVGGAGGARRLAHGRGARFIFSSFFTLQLRFCGHGSVPGQVERSCGEVQELYPANQFKHNL